MYAGLGVALAGVLSLVRPLRFLRIGTRRRATLVVVAGALLAVAGALLPAPARRVAAPASRLDEIIPEWQFAERHEVRIQAPPGRVETAIRQVTAREIRLFRVLTWIRNPGRTWSEQPESLLAAPAERPILDVALGSGFLSLAEVPEREIVVGTLVVVPPEHTRLPEEERRSPAWLVALDDPGYAKAVMGFLIEDEGDGWSRVVTETRVVATDAAARRRFAAYWRLIYPGSALIRRAWLQAIRQRAERPDDPVVG